MSKKLFLFIVVLVFITFTPIRSTAATFHYSADNTPVTEFLCAYATFLNRACMVAPEVGGNITGQFSFNNPQEFMGFLDRSENISTYLNASTMHFDNKSALQNEIVALGFAGKSTLTSNLRQMGAYDPQYPLRSGEDGMMVMVTAPKAYVDIIQSVASTIIQLAPPVPKVTRVFKLKHAFAEDLTVNLGQQTKTLPGVASLLRQLVGTQDIDQANTSASSTQGQVNRRMGQGLVRAGGGTQGYVPTQQDAQGKAQGSIASPVATTGARILADPRLNAVIVWDEEHLMPFYDTIIEELDKSVFLVEIRAAIADVNVNSMRSLGLAYNFNRNVVDGTSVFGGANTGTATNPLDFASTIGQGLQVTSVFTNGIDTLMARIEALETEGNASVLSRPTVLTSDHIEAVLENTNTFYVRVEGYETVDLFDVTYGTVLRVTPQIVQQDNGKPLVKLVVNVEDGVSTPPSGGSGLDLPQVGKTTISTQAVVGNQQALVIGGYYYETKQVVANGIPVLMHIPVLGHLFKTEEDTVGKQERLFIISPRIIDPKNLPDLPSSLATNFDKTMHPRVAPPPPPSGGCSKRVYSTPEARKTMPAETPTVSTEAMPIGSPVVRPMPPAVNSDTQERNL